MCGCRKIYLEFLIFEFLIVTYLKIKVMIFATFVLQSLKFKNCDVFAAEFPNLPFGWYDFFYLKNKSVFINSLFEETTSCKYSFQTMACPVIWQSWKHKWKNGGATTMYESNVCFKFYNVHVWCMYMNPCQQWDFPKAKNRANLKWNLVVPWLHLWNMFQMQALSSAWTTKVKHISHCNPLQHAKPSSHVTWIPCMPVHVPRLMQAWRKKQYAL